MTKTYVVTGAASGLGAATAALLRGRGDRVIGVDRLAGPGIDVVADLSDAAGRRRALDAITGLADSLAGVVPAAGIAGITGTDSATLVSVNYFGAIDLVTGLRPLLGDGGAVVLLSSTSVSCNPLWPGHLADRMLAGDEQAARAAAARYPSPLVYPASKAALAWWARREGLQWARAGIRVNAVAPGLITTPMTDGSRADPVFGPLSENYPTAVGRRGEPEEVAQLVAFLLGDAASYLVGTTVFVDGGTDALTNPRRPAGRVTNRLASEVVGLGLRGYSWWKLRAHRGGSATAPTGLPGQTV